MEALKITIVLFLCWFAAVQCSDTDGLSEHNRLRKRHGSPPLALNQELSAKATEKAKTLASKKSLAISTNEHTDGENKCIRNDHPETCVYSWYREVVFYDFSKPGFSVQTAHFTQLIWAASTELGWGEAKSDDGIFYVVAMYTPPGNVEGLFEENVRRASGGHSALGNAMIISICFGLLKLTY